MPLVFLPYVELLWKRVPASLKEIKLAGFDGIECHLIGRLRSPKRVTELCNEAADLNLGIHFHQGWSWRTGQKNFYNAILHSIGALVPVGTSIDNQIYNNIDLHPVVIYGNLINEPGWPNYRYQTASEHDGLRYAMPFDKFKSSVVEKNLPVVFDTQHALEWFQNVQGVEGLPINSLIIRNLVTYLWQELRPYVVEIHLCDFNPQLGRSHGRNVFLGNGVFPFVEFCNMVRKSGWDGVVVPEVRPQYFRGARSLQMLYEKVDSYFKVSLV